MNHNFKRLTAWQKSIQFTSAVYKLVATFPKSEQYVLIDQLKRAAISISLNIAEGSGSGSNPEFCRFLYISKRSVYEVIAGFEIAHALHFVSAHDLLEYTQQAEEIASMIEGLIQKLRKS